MGFFKPNVEKLKDKRDVIGLIEALGYQKDSDVRRSAADALGQIGDVRAVEPLLNALKDSNDTVRTQAEKALYKIEETWGQTGDARAIVPLIAALKDSDTGVRRIAADVLRQTGDVRAVETFIAALKDSDSHVQRIAIEALKKIGDVRAIEPLIATLKDPDRLVRIIGIDALGKVGDARTVEPLIAALKDTDSGVRSRVPEALGKIGDARAVEPLIAVLKDSDKYMRRNAVEALGKIGDARAIEFLQVALLEDEDQDVRKLAVEALSKIGDARAVEALAMGLKDTRTRSQVAEVLQKLNYQPSNDLEDATMAVATRQWGKAVSFGAMAVELLQEAPRERAVGEALAEIDNALAVQWFLNLQPQFPQHYVDSLLKAINRDITSLSGEQLRELSSLNYYYNNGFLQVGERGEPSVDDGYGKCTEINELAQQELIRRANQI